MVPTSPDFTDDRSTPTHEGLRVALMLESDGPGGAESVVFTLAMGLRSRGVSVLPVVLSPGQGWLTSKLKREGFHCYQPTLRKPLDFRFARQMASWATDNRVDLFHAHEFTLGFYSFLSGTLSQVPHIITMHGGRGFAGALRRRLALALAARSASQVVGVSESTARHLAGALWIDPNRIAVVPNGIAFVEGDRISARAALSLKSSCRFILAVGNLYTVKGHSVLIEAAALLARDGTLPEWRIGIAGRGDERERLEQLIAANGLQEHVHLLGLRNDIPDLLSASDVWVMPSLSEGLPMALLEAMFARVPVVASAVGGIPSLVHNGETGLSVSPGDPTALYEALKRMLSSPEQAAKMAELGYLRVNEAYSQETMVGRYLGMYKEALKRN